MTKNQRYYKQGKANTRNMAIEWYSRFGDGDSIYYSELAEITSVLQPLAKRFGLLQEFRENGIL